MFEVNFLTHNSLHVANFTWWSLIRWNLITYIFGMRYLGKNIPFIHFSVILGNSPKFKATWTLFLISYRVQGAWYGCADRYLIIHVRDKHSICTQKWTLLDAMNISLKKRFKVIQILPSQCLSTSQMSNQIHSENSNLLPRYGENHLLE